MKKKAVVYDKWLHSLGGGEVVACNIVKALKKAGYDVLFICGKRVDPKRIYNKLGIDLSDIPFEVVWDDEIRIKKLSSGKDLFVNTTFMDYTFGYAKKNIYYTHFPTEAYVSITGRIFNEFILPMAASVIPASEFIKGDENKTLINRRFGHLLDRGVVIVFSYLQPKKNYVLKFSLFFENIYSSLIKSVSYSVKDADILDRQVTLDTDHNVMHFRLRIKVNKQKVTLSVEQKSAGDPPHLFISNNIFILFPKVLPLHLPDFAYRFLYERVNTRVRAGIFINLLERLKTYDLILANSHFTQKWIKNYWGRQSEVLFPPVEMMFKKHPVEIKKKSNWICHVGRFFTPKRGHTKKQEILVDAFIKMYKGGLRNWHLHLIGGLDSSDDNIAFAEKLKEKARGYPIRFHFNAEYEKLVRILMKSKIYWHATGYGENEKKHPIRFEHFGIAPIEAVGAGCIPVVYKGGGLEEVIHKLELDSNSLFCSKKELAGNTTTIIDRLNKYDFNKLYRRAEEHFSKNSFKKQFNNIINSL